MSQLKWASECNPNQRRQILTLGEFGAFDRQHGRSPSEPLAGLSTTTLAPLYSRGIVEKAVNKPPGGSQSTIYWLTMKGQRIAKALGLKRCRHCGCTERNACIILATKYLGQYCSWRSDDVCSNPECVQKERRLRSAVAAGTSQPARKRKSR